MDCSFPALNSVAHLVYSVTIRFRQKTMGKKHLILDKKQTPKNISTETPPTPPPHTHTHTHTHKRLAMS